MHDRGFIKWAPFNSIINGKKVIHEVLDEKNKVKMPILSDEQKNNIEKSLLLHFYDNEIIQIDYFYAGKIYLLKGNIKKIDSIYHKIYLDNYILYFDQIIRAY